MMGDHLHGMDGGYHQMDPYMQQQGMQGYPNQHGGGYGQQYGQPQQQYMGHDPNFGYNMGGHPQQGQQQWFDSDL